MLLRLTLTIAASYLVLTQGEPFRPTSVSSWLIVALLTSNLAFLWLPRSAIESMWFGATLILVDTLGITLVLSFGPGKLNADFYIVYFFVLFMAAVTERLVLILVGTVLVSAGYLYSVSATHGTAEVWSTETLIRIPFFFAVVAMYGFLADRVRSERIRGLTLKRLSRRDPLTDLPNRRALEDRLERAIVRAARTKSSLAVLLLDLDDFKSVNDTYGHGVGDELLVLISKRLSSRTRRSDTISRLETLQPEGLSRLGGDEFAMVMAVVGGLGSAAEAIERLRELLAEPFEIAETSITISASVGVSVFDGDRDAKQPGSSEFEDVEVIRRRLLQRADRALMTAKRHGRNTLQFHDEEMDREVSAERALSRDLRVVLEGEELFLEYQPLVDLSTGMISGAEALVRWRHPQRGLIEPLDFIPIAERNGQIRSIGEWILRAACGEARSWPMREGDGNTAVAVNLSPVQILDRDLPAKVEEILRELDLPPDRLEVELTESVLLSASPAVTQTIRELHDGLGVKVSLDDFGQGYSSLKYLCEFPIDKVKVDQFFVRSFESDKACASVVRAIIALARELGIRVVAEGVETESQLNWVRDQGCDEAQGFYLGRPMVSADLRTMLLAGGLARPASPAPTPA